MRGEVAIAGRVGRERLWDLPERVYPPDVVIPPAAEAQRFKNERRFDRLVYDRTRAKELFEFEYTLDM